jgi:hypothetical protein
MDAQNLFNKALKEDKLADFIVGRGGFKYSTELLNYGGAVRHTYYDKFKGDVSKALKERHDRFGLVLSYFSFHGAELSDELGARRKLIRQLLDAEGQFVWDVVYGMNNIRGGIAFSNRDFLLVAIEKNEVRDYVLGKKRFCTFVSQADDPQWARGEEVAKYYKSLPEGVDKQKLRVYLVEALKPDAPEKFLAHIFKPLLT